MDALFKAVHAIEEAEKRSGSNLGPERSDVSWTELEEKYLTEDYEKGVGITELSKIHERTPSSIRLKIEELGLSQTDKNEFKLAREVKQSLDKWVSDGEPKPDNWGDLIGFLD
jgi:hypothetical protein